MFRNALYDLPDWPVNLAPGGGLIDAGTDTACLGPVALGTVCTFVPLLVALPRQHDVWSGLGRGYCKA